MRPTISIMIAAILAAGAMAAPASAGPTYETEVVIDDVRAHNPNGGTLLDFYGTVDAEGPSKCAKDRFIRLFSRLTGPNPGPDPEVGSTRSDSGAFWSLTVPGEEVQGIYYAKAPKRKLANGAVCLADKSNELEFTR